MTSVAELSIRRPVTTVMLFVSLFVIGLIAAFRLPLEAFPSVSFPIIFVQMPYAGSTPEEVERTVLRPAEEALATLSGAAEALANLGGVETETSPPGPHDLQGSIIAVSCPFCMTMMSDGVKNKEQESRVQVFDLAELVASAEGINA